MGKYLIIIEGCHDDARFEIELSPYEYRVLEKVAIENIKSRTCSCQPKIEIYSQYKKIDDDYYEYSSKDNLIPEEEEK